MEPRLASRAELLRSVLFLNRHDDRDPGMDARKPGKPNNLSSPHLTDDFLFTFKC